MKLSCGHTKPKSKQALVLRSSDALEEFLDLLELEFFSFVLEIIIYVSDFVKML